MPQLKINIFGTMGHPLPTLFSELTPALQFRLKIPPQKSVPITPPYLLYNDSDSFWKKLFWLIFSTGKQALSISCLSDSVYSCIQGLWLVLPGAQWLWLFLLGVYLTDFLPCGSLTGTGSPSSSLPGATPTAQAHAWSQARMQPQYPAAI